MSSCTLCSAPRSAAISFRWNSNLNCGGTSAASAPTAAFRFLRLEACRTTSTFSTGIAFRHPHRQGRPDLQGQLLAGLVNMTSRSRGKKAMGPSACGALSIGMLLRITSSTKPATRRETLVRGRADRVVAEIGGGIRDVGGVRLGAVSEGTRNACPRLPGTDVPGFRLRPPAPAGLVWRGASKPTHAGFLYAQESSIDDLRRFHPWLPCIRRRNHSTCSSHIRLGSVSETV